MNRLWVSLTAWLILPAVKKIMEEHYGKKAMTPNEVRNWNKFLTSISGMSQND